MRRIWNQPAYPIWSLSTCDSSGTPNMNICTYVSAISLSPKRFMVALYHGTKTLENVRQTKRGLLQLLAPAHLDIVRLCGKSSGHDKDKLATIQKRHVIKTHEELPYLSDCCGFAELDFDHDLEVQGDHTLMIAAMRCSRSLADIAPLTTEELREHGIIS